MSVNLIANLLTLIARYSAVLGRGRNRDQAREKPMQLRTGVGRFRQAADAKDANIHAEVASILPCKHIGCGLGGAKQQVPTAVKPVRIAVAVVVIWTCIAVASVGLDHGSLVLCIPIDLVGAH